MDLVSIDRNRFPVALAIDEYRGDSFFLERAYFETSNDRLELPYWRRDWTSYFRFL